MRNRCLFGLYASILPEVDRPRLVTDNGPVLILKDFSRYLGIKGIGHILASPVEEPLFDFYILFQSSYPLNNGIERKILNSRLNLIPAVVEYNSEIEDSVYWLSIKRCLYFLSSHCIGLFKS